jgi:quinol monooxygenase YgiN
MLSFTVRMRFAAEDHDEIASTLTTLAHASRLEPGCISYIPHFIEADPSTVLIYEQYVDEAALEAHRNTPHFKQHAIGGLYQRMRERSIENLIAVA